MTPVINIEAIINDTTTAEDRQKIIDEAKYFDIDIWFDQMHDLEKVEVDAYFDKLYNWAMTTLGDTRLSLGMALRLSKKWPAQMQELWGMIQYVPANYTLNAMRVCVLSLLQYTAEKLGKVRG